MLAGVAFLALSAQVAIPFAPLGMPFTLQSQAVAAVACLVGRRRALATTLAYLAVGAAGAPVFAGLGSGPTRLLGPHGGFLWGFVAAAWLVGGEHGRHRLVAWLGASALVLATGWANLALWVGPLPAWRAGVVPFWLSDLGKATIAYLLCRRLGLGFRPPAVGRRGRPL